MSLLYNINHRSKMGLMALEERQQVKQVPQRKSLMTKKFAISVIIILVILNLGVVYWIYLKAKASADSVRTATDEVTTFNKVVTNFPKEDISGEEISDLERYKGSVRTKYTNENGEISVEYKSEDAPSLILKFYKTQLAEKNWILTFASLEEITFQKENKTITIGVKELDNVSVIQISYS